jgi:hypothetical protein
MSVKAVYHKIWKGGVLHFTVNVVYQIICYVSVSEYLLT